MHKQETSDLLGTSMLEDTDLPQDEGELSRHSTEDLPAPPPWKYT